MALIAWARTAAPELRTLAEGGAPVLWPIGSTEQHGAHLATGMDHAAAAAVSERAAAAARSDVVLLPALAFGASDHWIPLGATASLSAATCVAVIADVARSVAAAGFRRLTIVNGHAGNIGPALTALGDTTIAMEVELISYWTLVPNDLVASACKADDGGIGHAGELETSIALYLDDGIAMTDRVAAASGLALGGDTPGSARVVAARSPRPAAEAPEGVYGDPRPARAELGALVVDGAVAALAAHLDAQAENAS